MQKKQVLLPHDFIDSTHRVQNTINKRNQKLFTRLLLFNNVKKKQRQQSLKKLMQERL